MEVYSRIAVLVILLVHATGCGSPNDPATIDLSAGVDEQSTQSFPAIDSASAVLPTELPESDPALVATLPATISGDSTISVFKIDSLEARLDRIERILSTIASDEDQRFSSTTAIDTISTASPRKALESAADNLGNFGLKIFVSIVLLFLTYYFIRVVVWLLDTASERSAKRRLFFKKLIPIVRIIFWSFIIYLIIAKIFNVDRQGLIAAGAAIGVAVGFAAQDVLKNIFGGILIILDQPFQVGDKINVAGTYGEVVSIGLRSTRIVTPDDNLVTVPNTQVVDGQVANANAGALHCQVVTTLYLPGDTNVKLAKDIAYEAAVNSRYVFLDKPIVVLVKDHFEYRFLTKIVVKAYVLDTRYEFVFSSEITEVAKMEFQKNGLLSSEIDVQVFDAKSQIEANPSAA